MIVFVRNAHNTVYHTTENVYFTWELLNTRPNNNCGETFISVGHLMASFSFISSCDVSYSMCDHFCWRILHIRIYVHTLTKHKMPSEPMLS